MHDMLQLPKLFHAFYFRHRCIQANQPLVEEFFQGAVHCFHAVLTAGLYQRGYLFGLLLADKVPYA